VSGRGNTHFGPSGPAIIAPCPHRTSSALVPNIESRGNGNTEAAVFPKEQIAPAVRPMLPWDDDVQGSNYSGGP